MRFWRLPSRRDDARSRREAARWFARLLGPRAALYRPAFDRWRGADSNRQAAYDRLEHVWNEAAVLVHSPLRVSAVPAEFKSRRRLASWPSHTVRAVGLAIAVLGGLSFVGLRTGWLDASLESLGWSPRISTQVSEVRSVRLADGSSVILDTDTELATGVGAHARRIRLMRGRARFDVIADRGRPFVVVAGDGEMAAADGVFDVALTQDDAVTITPLRGVVQVDRARDWSAGPPIPIATGQRLMSGSHFSNARTTKAQAPGAWPSGVLSFDATPLALAVCEINRYTRQKIVLDAPSLADQQISGAFKATATAQFAASLATMFSLRLDRDSAGDFVLTRPVTS